MQETDSGVNVLFERGGRRSFDLVVGADGMHSKGGSLSFGEEANFVNYLGYYVSIFTIPSHLNSGELCVRRSCAAGDLPACADVGRNCPSSVYLTVGNRSFREHRNNNLHFVATFGDKSSSSIAYQKSKSHGGSRLR